MDKKIQFLLTMEDMHLNRRLCHLKAILALSRLDDALPSEISAMSSIGEPWMGLIFTLVCCQLTVLL